MKRGLILLAIFKDHNIGQTKELENALILLLCRNRSIIHIICKKNKIQAAGKRIAVLFREAALMIYPNMTKGELSRFSVHSLQVWACVLLDKAGMSPEFIMSRLQWMGNLFQLYLRDTGMIQDKHRDILRAA